MIPRLPRGFSQPMHIGGGAFGTVVRARQVALDRWVAVKLIAGKGRRERQILLKEARTQAALQIDCIPQIYDAFAWAGKVCIVMQWIEGVSLQQLLKTPLDHTRRQWIAQGFITALARLHQAGFAHRDLKPANILLSPSGGLFLIDFGFSRQTEDPEKSMAGIAKGTPAYMAPEVLHGGAGIDLIRADIYSAGVILREILTETPQAEFAGVCLAQKPKERIANGSELLTRWRGVAPRELDVPRWRELAGPATAQSLSRQLYRAARHLLGRGKDEQAYWLLVESLEQDPDYQDALTLLNTYPHAVGRQRLRTRLLWAGALGAALLIGVGIHQEISKRQSLLSQAIAAVAGTDREAKINPPAAKRAAAVYTATLREGEAELHHLVGRILLTNRPAKGRLWIDEQPLDSAAAAGAITLPYGEHHFAWRLADGATIWRERVMVLPFCHKRLNVWRRE